MPLVFAYGSNMDAAAMARRCPRAKPLGLARLVRHRLAVMREGWLTVVRDPHGSVHGVLWDLALSDMPGLDRYECLAQGLYVKSAQPVVTPAGAKRAVVYFGSNPGPGASTREYAAAVLAAARSSRLPSDGIAALEAVLLAPPARRGGPA